MSFVPRPHEIYKHFKGNLYQIVAIAEHSETGEQLVIYQALYGEFKTYARPLSMFVSPVDKTKYPEVTQEYRFELQGEQRDRGMKPETEAVEKVVEAVPADKSVEKPMEAIVPVQEVQNTVVEQAVQGNATVGIPQPSILEQPATTVQPVTTGQTITAPQEEETVDLDPMIVQFLDADTYEERLNILAGLHHRITDDMITTMAVACDVEVAEGELEERYAALKTCLITLEKYECNRLR